MARLIAFIVLLIPGIGAALGIKLMRDSLFGHLFSPFPFIWMQFLGGFILFAAGLGFFAGFLLRRDRRKNRVSDKFKKEVK